MFEPTSIYVIPWVCAIVFDWSRTSNRKSFKLAALLNILSTASFHMSSPCKFVWDCANLWFPYSFFARVNAILSGFCWSKWRIFLKFSWNWECCPFIIFFKRWPSSRGKISSMNLPAAWAFSSEPKFLRSIRTYCKSRSASFISPTDSIKF